MFSPYVSLLEGLNRVHRIDVRKAPFPSLLFSSSLLPNNVISTCRSLPCTSSSDKDSHLHPTLWFLRLHPVTAPGQPNVITIRNPLLPFVCGFMVYTSLKWKWKRLSSFYFNVTLPLVSHAAQCLSVLYYPLLCELPLIHLSTLLLKHIGWFRSLLYTLARVSFPASRTLLTRWGSSCFSEEEECREPSLHMCFPHRLKKHLFQPK